MFVDTQSEREWYKYLPKKKTKGSVVSVPKASLEQHIQWIREGGYTITGWWTEGYPKFKSLGALRRPELAFKMRWTELAGGDMRGLRKSTLEQHIRWIREGGYSAPQWIREGYPKFKSLGAYKRPHEVFKVRWTELAGESRRGKPASCATLEQHIQWIREGGYTLRTWKSDGYRKFKQLGAMSEPHVTFKVRWSELTAKNPRSP